MSRYRPPGKPSAAYITAEGEARLRAELRQLWSEERPRVTQQVADAAALGDRSENAEYIYGKKRLREIDRRIRYLSKRLDEVTVVRERPADTSRIRFAATVELESEAGTLVTYRLVGADEIDLRKGNISVDSPVGRALLGKSLGSEVLIHTPAGETVYTVRSIRYE